jgi:hypothetical protein
MDWRSQFSSIWHIDFEYQEDANHLPIPICLYCFEEHTGRSISLWRYELLKLDRAPFDTGPSSLIVAYASNAELGCFLSLNWSFPHNVLDIYVETIVAINGDTRIWPPAPEPGQKKRKGRQGLLCMCSASHRA